MVQKKVYKCGYSCSIVLPKTILKQANFGNPTGKKLNVRAVGNAIVLTKPHNKMTDINRLFSHFNYKKYNHDVRKMNDNTLEWHP